MADHRQHPKDHDDLEGKLEKECQRFDVEHRLVVVDAKDVDESLPRVQDEVAEQDGQKEDEHLEDGPESLFKDGLDIGALDAAASF